MTRPGAGSGLRRAVGDEGGEAGQGAEGGREANGGTAVLISRAGRQVRRPEPSESLFVQWTSMSSPRGGHGLRTFKVFHTRFSHFLRRVRFGERLLIWQPSQ